MAAPGTLTQVLAVARDLVKAADEHQASLQETAAAAATVSSGQPPPASGR